MLAVARIDRCCEGGHMGPLLALLISALAIVVSTPGAANIASANSSAELTFTRVNGQRHSVWVANADGSAARKVAEPALNGGISSDGHWLAYSRLHSSPYGARFAGRYVVNLAGGKPRRVGDVVYEQWAPDGAMLAISDSTGLFVLEPASGSRRVIVRGRHVHSARAERRGAALSLERGEVHGKAAESRAESHLRSLRRARRAASFSRTWSRAPDPQPAFAAAAVR